MVERTLEDGSTIDEPIFVELRRLGGSEATITFVVDELPTRAGIDPRSLLIDRLPRDNLKAVELIED